MTSEPRPWYLNPRLYESDWAGPDYDRYHPADFTDKLIEKITRETGIKPRQKPAPPAPRLAGDD